MLQDHKFPSTKKSLEDQWARVYPETHRGPEQLPTTARAFGVQAATFMHRTRLIIHPEPLQMRPRPGQRP